MRNAASISIFLLVTLLTTGCASLLAPDVKTEATALREGSYELDQAHATLLFKVGHLDLSTYVGRFNSFDASLEFDEEDPESARLEAIVDVTSLDVNNTEFSETLIGSGWFDTEAFPQARFVSSNVKVTGNQTGQAIGELTIRGVTQPATMDITFRGGARNNITQRYTVGFDATLKISRSAYGIDRYAGFVSDEVSLEFYGEFQRQ